MKPYAFIQDWGVFPEQTMVVIGTRNPDNYGKLIRKLHATPAMAKEIVEKLKQEGEMGKDTDKGFFFFLNLTRNRFSCLYFKEWPKKAAWENYETLIHELHHAVYFILGECRGLMKEPEAQAYMVEGLFHSIRRKLDGLDKCEKVYL